MGLRFDFLVQTVGHHFPLAGIDTHHKLLGAQFLDRIAHQFGASYSRCAQNQAIHAKFQEQFHVIQGANPPPNCTPISTAARMSFQRPNVGRIQRAEPALERPIQVHDVYPGGAGISPTAGDFR